MCFTRLAYQPMLMMSLEIHPSLIQILRSVYLYYTSITLNSKCQRGYKRMFNMRALPYYFKEIDMLGVWLEGSFQLVVIVFVSV
jgi:hypothetical protein